ncbi:hypothetical protein APS56_04675 [Pseudalgibacter alginicilyticus]|uniref:Uncharacterized protein n=1 Tax=Pseudalgibacter alginicilyticus TaxID=1736674 RepID=A0A0P0CVM5_9FLAO|nr:hypothetical protein APS56_04675 [Pseudalgibacter alginicilyticus]
MKDNFQQINSIKKVVIVTPQIYQHLKTLINIKNCESGLNPVEVTDGNKGFKKLKPFFVSCISL